MYEISQFCVDEIGLMTQWLPSLPRDKARPVSRLVSGRGATFINNVMKKLINRLLVGRG
jgi:hypothetical protein